MRGPAHAGRQALPRPLPRLREVRQAMSGEDLNVKARLRAAARARINDLIQLGYEPGDLEGLNLLELDALKAKSIELQDKKDRAYRDLMGAPRP